MGTSIFRLLLQTIGLRNNYQNIGLVQLSDFKYRTSNTALPIFRAIPIGLTRIYQSKTGKFTSFLSSEIKCVRHFNDFFVNFRVLAVTGIITVADMYCLLTSLV
jgi:hypothetical protein